MCSVQICPFIKANDIKAKDVSKVNLLHPPHPHPAPISTDVKVVKIVLLRVVGLAFED